MHSPYTTQPLDALMGAQTSVGLVLGSLLIAKPLRPRPATALLLLAIALAVLTPVIPELLRNLGLLVPERPTLVLLELAGASAALASALTRRRALTATAVIGTGALFWALRFFTESDWELAAAHLALDGLLIGVHWRGAAEARAIDGTADSPADAPARAHERDERVIFVAATVAAAVVSYVVLRGRTNSGDEWANTYQAALFAKGRAFGAAPACGEAFRSFYVFQYLGRAFGMYTPGWPLFMAPFAAVRAPWLAGPASTGILAVAMARLGRRAASGFAPGQVRPSAELVRASGWLTAAAVALSPIVLINGASRYPHVFVAAMFAWSVELLCAAASARAAGVDPRRSRVTGALLGACVAFMLSARPADGATLGVGLAAYFVFALARRRLDWRVVGAAAATFAAIAGLTLVILRLQLGRWFATGYSLNEIFYPWNVPKWSVPRPSEYRWGVPLATGAYFWWPCSPAVALAGLAALFGDARRLASMFLLSALPVFALYSMSELGRGFDFGYGPRYSLVHLVPMGVGTGVVLARLWDMGRSPSIGRAAVLAGGPAAVALAAAALGVIRIAPLVYVPTYADVHEHNRMHDAIDRAALDDAVVFGGQGLNNTDPMDLTENLPLELYDHQSVLIAIDRGPEAVRCVRERYGSRSFYRALPGDPARIVPF
jgi:hypothetical protein